MENKKVNRLRHLMEPPPLTPVTMLRCWVRSGQLESSPCCPQHGPGQHCDGGQGGRGSIRCLRRLTFLFSLPGYHRSSGQCSCPSHDAAEARRHASTPHAHLQVGNMYAHSHGSSQNTMHTHMSQTPAYTHVSKMHRLPLEHGGVA